MAISTALVLCGCTPHGPRELLQGKKLIERAKYTQAREKLVRATGILKTNANAWNYLGVASQHAGDSAEAEKAYQRALLIDHDLSEAHFNLGCLYLEQNRATAARNELTAFCLRRADSLDGLLMLGLAQLRCRDGAAAEKTFSDALRLSPDHAEALNGLGLARLQRGKPAEALAFFATALKVQPKYAPALLNCAIVYQGYLKDNRAALEKYKQYLALKPPPDDYNAVKAHVHALEAELAPPPLARAATNTPAAMQTTQTDSPPAVAIANRYGYRNPPKPSPRDSATSQKFFAEALQAQQAHRTTDAIAAYRSAVQADPANYQAWYNLAVAATATGDSSSAFTAYEQALAINPDSNDARYNFALLLRQSNYFIDAANELEKLLARYPNEARAHLVAGSIYADQLHDPAKARQHYQKLLEVDPRNLQAATIRSWLSSHSN